MALQFTSRQLAANAVTTVKIANDAVTNDKIADDAVNTAQLADGAVDNARIAANAVNAAKMDLTGAFDYSSGTLSVATPIADAHAATKAYVDNAAVGLYWKEPVRASSTANLTLSGTQTVDGISLTAGQRILVKNQSAAAENGIYVVAAGAWARSGDMNSAGEFSGTACFVQEGSVHADTAFVCTNDGDVVVGTTAIAFVQFAGNGSILGGDGIAVTGNTVAVDLAASAGLEFSGGKLQSKVKANGGLLRNADGLSASVNNGVLIDGSGFITLQLDGATLGKSASGVKIADGGVGTTQLADLGVTAAKLGSNAVETAKINGLAVTTAKIANLSVTNGKIGDDAVDGGKIADDAVANEHIAADAVQTAQILNANVTTAKIANDSVTLDKVGWTPELYSATGDGSATTFDLSHQLSGDFYKMVMIYINGQFLKMVSSSPADASEYQLTDTGSATRITFGAAPESGDSIDARYVR